MSIAREGYSFVLASFLFAIAITGLFGWIWAVPFWLIAIFILQFFREPDRTIPTEAGVVVSPADGKVVSVSEAKNPFNDENSTRIAIFLNVFSVHSNRIPIAGRIVEQKYISGKFFNAAIDKSSEENERNMIVIRTEHGNEVTCVQIAGLIARRILWYVSKDDEVALGQKYGFIKFGSRVELFLPLQYRVLAGIGDKVRGGADIIAETSEAN